MEEYLNIDINIDFDAAERITTVTLKNDLDLLINSSEEGFPPLYSFDKKIEKKRVDKLIKAYKIVLEYYGVSKDDAESRLDDCPV